MVTSLSLSNLLVALFLGCYLTMTPIPALADSRSVSEIKADILALAQSYMGQGDEDFSRQKALNILVDELLASAPQPPVAERIGLLQGVWYQVFGAYDYRNDGRGVDPATTPEEIYQAVFSGGYYYNVSPIRGKNTVALLRGVYRVVDGSSDFLRVRFTSFKGNAGRLVGSPLWELAALAEADELPDKITVVPTLIVRLFFGGGYLREVYTDEDLRITYGGDERDDRKDEYIYVMTRVG